MGEYLNIILTGYLILAAVQTVLWIIQNFTKDASTTDVGWCLGMPVLAGWYFINLEGFALRKLLIFVPLVIWSLRLSFHLVRRMRHAGKEDSRYAQLRDEWGGHAGRNFFFIYQIQPVFDLILSVPFFIVFMNPDPAIKGVEIAALFLWAGGLAGETLADEQLRRFTANPANKGRVCQNGLWRYSRHPNFFFEWVMWVAYFVFALGSPYGLYGAVAPALMLVLLLKVTGIPIMEERALKKKGEAFREYQGATSFFFPMPPRKKARESDEN